jgi:Restriction endonuclease
MADLKSIYDEALAHFMTAYPTDSSPARLQDCVQTILRQKYAAEKISEFLGTYLARLQEQLVDEFNNRYDKGYSVRYKILDDIGNLIAGIGDEHQIDRIQFQDALNELTAHEFEALSAYVLKVCGCLNYWRTPATHDQGIDAFGYFHFMDRLVGDWVGAKPRFFFLAQAKHFRDSDVGSHDIREFVGSYVMSMHKIYSTVNEKYPELTLLPFGPTALVFITTQELPHTVKRMSMKSGIIVLSSDDLFDILIGSWGDKPRKIESKWVLGEIRNSIRNIPNAG